MRLKLKRLWVVLILTAIFMPLPGLSAVASAAGTGANDPQKPQCYSTNLSNCQLVTDYIDPFINLLVALVGIAVVASIIVGGIQYSSSAGDPGKASAAKRRIRDALIALLAFALLYTLLNFLIPGGLF